MLGRTGQTTVLVAAPIMSWNMNLDSGLILTFVGVIAAALPFALAWRANTGPSRKLEALAKTLDQLPESSIARKNVLESIDWLSREIVRRERRGRNPATFVIGFVLYFGGAMGALFPIASALRAIEMFGTEAHLSEYVIWAVVCVVVSAAGLLLSAKTRIRPQRRRALSHLDQLEASEIIRAHRRRHGGRGARP